MGRITRPPRRPKPKFVHEVRVGRDFVGQPWLQEELDRIAGPNGYRRRTPFWAYTVFSFVLKAQADAFELQVQRRHELADREERARHPCPIRVRYEEAARNQHAVIWGLSTGVLPRVVERYRAERMECSTHGHPSWQAARVILEIAPTLEHAHAREMVNAMLAWTIERDGWAFWEGLQGDPTINRY